MNQKDFEEIMRQRMAPQGQQPAAPVSRSDPMWNQAEKFRQIYEAGGMDEDEYDWTNEMANELAGPNPDPATARNYMEQAEWHATPRAPMVNVEVLPPVVPGEVRGVEIGEPMMPGSVQGVEIGPPVMPGEVQGVEIGVPQISVPSQPAPMWDSPAGSIGQVAEQHVLDAGREEVARTLAREHHLWATSKMPKTFKDEAKVLLQRIESNTANEHEAERYMQLRTLMQDKNNMFVNPLGQ